MTNTTTSSSFSAMASIRRRTAPFVAAAVFVLAASGLPLASAANSCSALTNATSCRSAQADGCQWMPSGACIAPCYSIGANSTRCAEYAPSCEFINQKCRSINPCAAVSAQKCSAVLGCRLDTMSATATVAATCTINCTMLSTDYCSTYFGSFCVATNNTLCQNREATPNSTVAPTTAYNATTSATKPTETKPANSTAAPTSTTAYNPCTIYKDATSCARNPTECQWVASPYSNSSSSGGATTGSCIRVPVTNATTNATASPSTAKPTETKPANSAVAPTSTTTAYNPCTIYTDATSCARNPTECQWVASPGSSNTAGATGSCIRVPVTNATATATTTTAAPTTTSSTTAAPTTATTTTAALTTTSSTTAAPTTATTTTAALTTTSSTTAAPTTTSSTTAAPTTTSSTTAVLTTAASTTAALTTTSSTSTTTAYNPCTIYTDATSCARNPTECQWVASPASSDIAVTAGSCIRVPASPSSAKPSETEPSKETKVTETEPIETKPANSTCSIFTDATSCGRNVDECQWVVDDVGGSCVRVATKFTEATASPPTKETEATETQRTEPAKSTTSALTTATTTTAASTSTTAYSPCTIYTDATSCARNPTECQWVATNSIINSGVCVRMVTTAVAKSTTTKSAETPRTEPTQTKPPATTTTRLMPTPTAPTPMPTRIPPHCLPSQAPTIVANYTDMSSTATTTTVMAPSGSGTEREVSLTRWLYVFATVGPKPYFACNVDVAGVVNVSWTIREAATGAVVALPSTVGTTGRVFALPPGTFAAAGRYSIVATAAFLGLSSSSQVTAIVVLPAPTISIVGAPSMTVGGGLSGSFFLSADVRKVCEAVRASASASADANADANGASAAGSVGFTVAFSDRCSRDTGMEPYLCDGSSSTANGGRCDGRLVWSCQRVDGDTQDCGDALTSLLATGRTLYRNITGVSVGTYVFVATFQKTVAANITVTVVAPVKPSIAVACVGGRFEGERLACTAIADRSLNIVWWYRPNAAAGSSSGAALVRDTRSGQYITFDAVPAVVSAVATDRNGNDNTATVYLRKPVAVNVRCSRSVDMATGLNTSVTVRCAIITTNRALAIASVASPLSLSYSYRVAAAGSSGDVSSSSTANETLLSAVNQIVDVNPTNDSSAEDSEARGSDALTFIAPPVSGSVSVIVRLYFEGSVIGAVVVLTPIRVTYTFSTADVSTLRDQIKDGKDARDDTAVVSAAATLSAAGRADGTSATERRDIAAIAINALADVIVSNSSSSSSSSSPASDKKDIPDATALMAANAITSTVIGSATLPPPSGGYGAAGRNPNTNNKAGPSTDLSPADATRAANALAAVAATTAAKGTDAAREALLVAAAALSSASSDAANRTTDIIAAVAAAILGSAPADGSAPATAKADSVGVKVAALQFPSTQSGNRNVSVGASSVKLPANFTIPNAAGSSSPTTTAGLTATSTPAVVANRTTPAPAGANFASPVTRFEVFVGGNTVPVHDVAGGIAIRIALDTNQSSSSTSSHTILYWNETQQKWRSNGVTTSKCEGSDAATGTQFVCGVTTHFTAFAAFSGDTSYDGDDDGSKSKVAVIVGVVIGVVLIAAVATVVIMKTRSTSKRNKRLIDEENAAGAIPLSELSAIEV